MERRRSLREIERCARGEDTIARDVLDPLTHETDLVDVERVRDGVRA